MLSLIYGLAAAVLSILNNFLHVPYAGLVSFICGIAAWVAGDKALNQNTDDRAAYYGRLIGIVSTVVVGMSLIVMSLSQCAYNG